MGSLGCRFAVMQTATAKGNKTRFLVVFYHTTRDFGLDDDNPFYKANYGIKFNPSGVIHSMPLIILNGMKLLGRELLVILLMPSKEKVLPNKEGYRDTKVPPCITNGKLLVKANKGTGRYNPISYDDGSVILIR
jgi:hypothetical protein